MPLPQEQKQQVISEFQVHETDTGSADVQVAILTNRIEQLTQHLKQNPKDYNSRRGLFMMIGKRKQLLSYIAKGSPAKFKELTDRLNIRVKK